MSTNLEEAVSFFREAASLVTTQQKEHSMYLSHREKNMDELVELKMQSIRDSEMIEKYKRENEELQKLLEETRSKLKDNESELEGVFALNQALSVTERHLNSELQGVRRVLIDAFRSQTNKKGEVFVKIMGELPRGPFAKAVRKKRNSKRSVKATKRKCASKRNRLLFAADLS